MEGHIQIKARVFFLSSKQARVSTRTHARTAHAHECRIDRVWYFYMNNGGIYVVDIIEVRSATITTTALLIRKGRL